LHCDAQISKRTAREPDLPAFEIGVTRGTPSAVMRGYNRINGDYVCQNRWLLIDALKKDWKFHGFVVSGWAERNPRKRPSLPALETRSTLAPSTRRSTKRPSRRATFLRRRRITP
jgi:beta-glucosidase